MTASAANDLMRFYQKERITASDAYFVGFYFFIGRNLQQTLVSTLIVSLSEETLAPSDRRRMEVGSRGC